MSPTAQALPLCARGHTQPQAGGQFCIECGDPLLPAASPGAPGCALHPHVRAEQACSRCGNFACRACLRQGPDGSTLCAACEAREGAQDLPWDRRRELGTVVGFARTCWDILLHPARTLDRARPHGGAGSSLWFAILAEVTTYLTTLLLYGAGMAALFASLLLGQKGPPSTLSPVATAGVVTAMVAALGAMVLISAVGVTVLVSALDHLVLRLVGASPKSYQVTLRAHALSLAPAVLGLVPFCGPYVVPVWALVVRVFAYRAFHRTSTGQAVAGALAAPVTLGAIAVIGWVVLFILAGGLHSP